MPCVERGAVHSLPASFAGNGNSGNGNADAIAPRALRRRARHGSRRAALGALRQRFAGAGVRHAARREDVHGVAAHHVSHPGGHHEVRERRDQWRRPNFTKPELLATRPNELWSWDITKLLGPQKWTYFYLYVMLDASAATSWAG